MTQSLLTPESLRLCLWLNVRLGAMGLPPGPTNFFLVTNFQYLLAILSLPLGSAYYCFILALAESLHSVPFAGVSVAATMVAGVLPWLGKACVIAIQLAAWVIR